MPGPCALELQTNWHQGALEVRVWNAGTQMTPWALSIETSQQLGGAHKNQHVVANLCWETNLRMSAQRSCLACLLRCTSGHQPSPVTSHPVLTFTRVSSSTSPE